jgi:O-antigen/teichoic acid export membrane protein
MASFRKSLAVNFLSSSGATAVQFIVSLIVARILSPAEIGIYSIAIVLVNVAHVFRDFGVSTYLQREEDLDRSKVRSAMGVAYVIAMLIAALVFASSGWVAGYFGYSEIAPVMQILAISFLFIPFSSVALALLLREYDATKVAIGTFWGTGAFSVTCIGLALYGFGPSSLAWANMANVLATGLAYLWLQPRHMSYVPSFRQVGGILRFGSGALFTNLVKAANDALPDLVLGKIGTARQVGLVSRANSTVHMFLYIAGSAISFGSQTYLAKAHHGRESLEPVLYRAIALVTAVGWPMLAVTAVAAQDVVVGLYGPTWIDAAPSVLPLALMTAIELMFHYKTTAFNAIGRPYLASIPLLVTAAARIALTVALFDGGIVSFGWALMLATMVTAPVWLFLQRRYLGCGVRSFALALWPSAAISLACGLTAYLALGLIDIAGIETAILRLLLLAVPTGLCWLLCLKLLAHPLWDELQLVLQNLRSRSSARPDQAPAA